MKVWFVGAGPGAADLITVRGADVLRRVRRILYAGSLVPEAVLQHASPTAECINTMRLSLEEQAALYRQAAEEGLEEIARVHSGDPALYGATSEQIRILNAIGASYEIVPGVSSFSTAAAVARTDLTKPDISQTVILTRVQGRASEIPRDESLERLAEHRATLCLFLAGAQLRTVIPALREHYPDRTPIVLVHRASQPEERVHRSTLRHVLDEIRISDWRLTTMVLVGDVLDAEAVTRSRLYAADYSHRFRKGRTKEAR